MSQERNLPYGDDINAHAHKRIEARVRCNAELRGENLCDVDDEGREHWYWRITATLADGRCLTLTDRIADLDRAEILGYAQLVLDDYAPLLAWLDDQAGTLGDAAIDELRSALRDLQHASERWFARSAQDVLVVASASRKLAATQPSMEIAAP